MAQKSLEKQVATLEIQLGLLRKEVAELKGAKETKSVDTLIKGPRDVQMPSVGFDYTEAINIWKKEPYGTLQFIDSLELGTRARRTLKAVARDRADGGQYAYLNIRGLIQFSIVPQFRNHCFAIKSSGHTTYKEIAERLRPLQQLL